MKTDGRFEYMINLMLLDVGSETSGKHK